MTHLGNCPECGADLDSNEAHKPGCPNRKAKLSLAPLELNSTSRLGHKDDYLTFNNLVQRMLMDTQINIVPRYEAKVYSAAIKDGLDFLKATGFSSIADLNKIQEVTLALFYYVGMSYYRSGDFMNAAACLSIVYSQLRFLDRILSDFKQYPEQAGRALVEIKTSDKYEAKAEDVEAFLKQSLGKSGCFIATAASCSMFSPEVLVLSAFRDDVLLRGRIGRVVVRIYYAVSPPLARMVARSHFLQRTVMQFFILPASRLVCLGRNYRRYLR